MSPGASGGSGGEAVVLVAESLAPVQLVVVPCVPPVLWLLPVLPFLPLLALPFLPLLALPFLVVRFLVAARVWQMSASRASARRWATARLLCRDRPGRCSARHSWSVIAASWVEMRAPVTGSNWANRWCMPVSSSIHIDA
ncbi:hypothetical protein [Candidatus Microthrix parvicella]|uniref:hypothetical protein n=1 Tax=Candidatus Neomicrothrix parvicella TaxID=41950 RepID=UPI00035E2107|nr:hypothetical protein [Candidatus Microthrix parvicella]